MPDRPAWVWDLPRVAETSPVAVDEEGETMRKFINRARNNTARVIANWALRNIATKQYHDQIHAAIKRGMHAWVEDALRERSRG